MSLNTRPWRLRKTSSGATDTALAEVLANLLGAVLHLILKGIQMSWLDLLLSESYKSLFQVVLYPETTSSDIIYTYFMNYQKP